MLMALPAAFAAALDAMVAAVASVRAGSRSGTAIRYRVVAALRFQEPDAKTKAGVQPLKMEEAWATATDLRDRVGMDHIAKQPEPHLFRPGKKHFLPDRNYEVHRPWR